MQQSVVDLCLTASTKTTLVPPGKAARAGAAALLKAGVKCTVSKAGIDICIAATEPRIAKSKLWTRTKEAGRRARRASSLLLIGRKASMLATTGVAPAQHSGSTVHRLNPNL